jgi:hypothetical protein
VYHRAEPMRHCYVCGKNFGNYACLACDAEVPGSSLALAVALSQPSLQEPTFIPLSSDAQAWLLPLTPSR